MRAFWDGRLTWSRERGIDYHIGRTLAPRLASLGLTNISGTAETAIYNGGSLWANYWIDTTTELRGDLKSSGKLDEALIDKFLVHCADSTLVDPDDCFHSRAQPFVRWLSCSTGCDFASIE